MALPRSCSWRQVSVLVQATYQCSRAPLGVTHAAHRCSACDLRSAHFRAVRCRFPLQQRGDFNRPRPGALLRRADAVQRAPDALSAAVGLRMQALDEPRPGIQCRIPAAAWAQFHREIHSKNRQLQTDQCTGVGSRVNRGSPAGALRRRARDAPFAAFRACPARALRPLRDGSLTLAVGGPPNLAVGRRRTSARLRLAARCARHVQRPVRRSIVSVPSGTSTWKVFASMPAFSFTSLKRTEVRLPNRSTTTDSRSW